LLCFFPLLITFMHMLQALIHKERLEKFQRLQGMFDEQANKPKKTLF